MMVASQVSVVTATPAHLGHEFLDIDGIDAAVAALVDHLEDIIRCDEREGDLQTAGPPAAGDRHLPRTVGHLVARNGHRLEDAAADLLFRPLVHKTKGIAG